jgi:peroxiredoxin
MGLTFPVLHDPTGQVHEDYAQQHAFAQTIYPQDWIVGVDGTIVYVNNAYEVDAMRAILDDQLAQGSK